MEHSLEYILKSLSKDEMTEYIKSHPNKLVALIQLATSNKPPHSARATWLLSTIIVENDTRLQKHIPKIIEIIPFVKDGQQRDLIKMLCKMKINEEDEGTLFDTCVEIWTTMKKKPSVRYYAFKFMLQTVKKYPELYDEIALLSEEFYLDNLSSGIKKSIQKLIKNFEKEYKT